MAADLNMFIGLILLLGIHEMGHALSATFFGRYIDYVFQNGNPGVKHYIYVGQKSTPLYKIQIISSAGLIFNLLTINLVLPLLDDTIIEYFIFCIGIALGDIYSILSRQNILRLNRRMEEK
jgi:hypothetical protein